MSTGIGPGITKIFRPERGIVQEEFSFGGTALMGMNKQPDRDARADDTGFAAIDISPAFNAWVGISQVTDNPLQHLGFLSAAKFS